MILTASNDVQEGLMLTAV